MEKTARTNRTLRDLSVLFFTLMLGPMGLLFYMGLRFANRRTLRFEV